MVTKFVFYGYMAKSLDGDVEECSHEFISYGSAIQYFINIASSRDMILLAVSVIRLTIL